MAVVKIIVRNDVGEILYEQEKALVNWEPLTPISQWEVTQIDVLFPDYISPEISTIEVRVYRETLEDEIVVIHRRHDI